MSGYSLKDANLLAKKTLKLLSTIFGSTNQNAFYKRQLVIMKIWCFIDILVNFVKENDKRLYGLQWGDSVLEVFETCWFLKKHWILAIT